MEATEIIQMNIDNLKNTNLISELMNNIEQTESIPYIEKDKILMAPGYWNETYYSKEEIIKAFENTDWSDRYKSNLILDHFDESFSDWVGDVQNRRVDKETGYVYGDLYIYDPITAIKLSKGKPKTGISPKVIGDYDEKEKEMKDFVFENFSIVINPAVKKAYMYNSNGNKPIFFSDGGENMSKKKIIKNSEVEPTVESNNSLDNIFEKLYNGETLLKEEIDSLKNIVDSVKTEDVEETEEPKEEEEMSEETEEEVEETEEPKESQTKENEEPVLEKQSETKEILQEYEKAIKTMSQKITELSNKIQEFEAPVKVTKKGVVAEMSQTQDSDESMLNFLKGI
ncbi:MAG: hypothetical protein PHD05_09265 [Sphaerochaetaceae bacterium]|nr:hypothetical protein [Sphaerochaetaceae bacterium]